MNKVNEKTTKRTSENPPPPSSGSNSAEAGLRKPEKAARARPVLESVERHHERRISNRLADERTAHETAVREYTIIANEVEGGPLTAQSVAVVLATAIGSHPGDPLTAILEEIEQRCGTLTLVAQAQTARGVDLGDVIESLERELAMLRTRAAVAVEIVRRIGLQSSILRYPETLLKEDPSIGSGTIDPQHGDRN